jgi:hypothetical protein
MNCLTVVLWIWFKGGFQGQIIIIGPKNPFPHFGIKKEKYIYHYKANNNNLPWWKQFWFKGKIVKIVLKK